MATVHEKKSNDISYETTVPILMKLIFNIYMIVTQDLAKTDDDLKL